MSTPRFSVIVPLYKGAPFIGDAIRSVLDQTYTNLELIVVNDASPDHSADVVRQFHDPRLTLIEHPTNRGSDVSRQTGLQHSSGDVIAFLDQDDYIHPEKLGAHAEVLAHNPNVGFTYNARFELDYSAPTVRDIWRPPLTITLADLVLGFPIAPKIGRAHV